MIYPESAAAGSVSVDPAGPFRAGELVTLTVRLVVGREGLPTGARFRVGTPNTGWESMVVPQVRYWEEAARGADRRYAPFHPVNTTARVESDAKTSVYLETMERMLAPNEDPAEAYWRWWTTAVLEEGALAPGDGIVITYGDARFVGRGARIQTFPEQDITIAAYLDLGDGKWVRPENAPLAIDVVAGPARRANVVIPSVILGGRAEARIALTDECHCQVEQVLEDSLVLRGARGGTVAEIGPNGKFRAELEMQEANDAPVRLTLTDRAGETVWGASNPGVAAEAGSRQLFWGDLHAQSEYHVMHSQKLDARQKGWSKGISSGTPDEVYAYGRDISLLDFVAITDQGAITGVGWDELQAKAEEHYRPGSFVTFKAYEAGSEVGHRNVYFKTGAEEESQTGASFRYDPSFLYEFYRGRDDVVMIPHHVKAWTDWSFHDPALEPLMEVYSSWGQSENPSMELWNKGMTPGAGAWEALQRGYRLGMIASSDSHVGMPGRNYPHDRQVHTPFPSGLAAVWADELTRESVFEALRARRCYGTTGVRIFLRFHVNGAPMGAVLEGDDCREAREIEVTAYGTAGIDRVEIVSDGQDVIHTVRPETGSDRDGLDVRWVDDSLIEGDRYYYVRVHQSDGNMAWSSPVWARPASA